MIYIHTICIHNFKSFAGKHEFTNLDAHFTAIVGPNGSGKSNIIDSILFVLGFRARKLRQSVQIELIYKDEQRREFCSVELVFKRKVGGNDGFSIKRELSKNGKNRYFVDDKEVKTADVVDLLGREGVDMETNRFLILQGEIESIAMMKAKDGGMLEYLEDVIGTTSYNERIETSKKSIEELKLEFESKSTAFLFYEKEYKFVEEKKIECEKIMRQNLRYLESCKLVKRLEMEKMKRSIEKNKLIKQEKEEELKKVKSGVNESRVILKEKEEEMYKAKKEMKKHEDLFVKKKAEFRSTELMQNSYEEKRKKYEKTIKKLEGEIENQKRIKGTNEIESKKIEDYLVLKKQEIEKHESEKNKISLFLEKFEKKYKNSTMEIKNEMQKIEMELKTVYKKKGVEIENQVRNKKIKEDNLKKINLKSELENRINELEKLELLDEQEMKGILNEADSDLKQTWNELSRRKAELREIKRSEETNHGINRVNAAIKGIDGVFGRLSDLGVVDEKYEKAISAAAKGILNNLVVENTAVAEKCAEIIKKNGFMRTTFVILDRIAEIPSLKQEQQPYAFMLVKCEEKFKKAFYYALKDTLVVESIEDANKLAFGNVRKRVVTVDGKLIEKSGLMSSSKQSGGGLNKSKKIEAAVEKLTEALNEFENIKNNAQIGYQKIVENNENYRNKEKIKKELLERIGNIIFENEEINFIDYDSVIEEFKNKMKTLQEKLEKIYGGDFVEAKTELNNQINIINRIEKEVQSALLRQNEIVVSFDENKTVELEEAKGYLNSLKPVKDYEIKKSEVDTVEEAYKNQFQIYEKWSNEVNKIKNKIADEYYADAELRNKIEEITEGILKLKGKINKHVKDVKLVDEDIKIIQEHFDIQCVEIDTSEIIDEEIESKLKTENSNLNNLNLKTIEMSIFNEFKTKKTEFENIKIAFENCKAEVTRNTALLGNLIQERHDMFMDGFNKISMHLKEIYQTITFGGNAELELVDSLDPFTEGVMMSVMPPKKSWKNINNLSGGEKTISSLSLVFALHAYKPSPFYVMDEIDAALDFRNVSVIANYLSECTKNAQFIVISLRNDMFELSTLMIGVYKNDDKSRGMVVDTRLMH